MAVRSAIPVHDSRLYVATVTQTIATVPADEVWLIRTIALRSTTAALNPVCSLILLRSGVAAVLETVNLAATIATTLTGRYWCFEPGDDVRINDSLATTITAVLSGSRLVIP